MAGEPPPKRERLEDPNAVWRLLGAQGSAGVEDSSAAQAAEAPGLGATDAAAGTTSADAEAT
eukprot:1132082-Pyramimonas_sp.AAC.1